MLKKSPNRGKSYLVSKTTKRANDVFVFLEIFSREGGIQSYVKDVFQSYLALPTNCDAEVFILRDARSCQNPFESDDRLRFNYFKTSSPQVGRMRMATALFAYLVQNRPQHVYCGHVNLAPLVGVFCQNLGIPYTVMTHGKEVWAPLPNITKNSLQKADRIWAVSRYTRDIASTVNQLNPQRINILPCAVNGNYFTPGAKSAVLLKRYGLNQSQQVLMTVARLWSGDIYKGVDITIQALPQIAQAFPDVRYLVIGRGDDLPRLQQLAENCGVSDRVVFAGFVPTEELVEHYRLADAYIMPSQEGFGIVYLEAMACGVPVLAGDNDGSADPLQNSRLGWRVPHRDIEAVAKGCIEILTGNDQRCNGQWLREEVISHFGFAAFQARLQEQFLAPPQARRGRK
ncbi:glycosyltransferase [Calothrix sp. UHCC 0171]|uniref:glycosyltransferase n=1 Tax=Calothrix sp. UHCC 0171 TaxID=3110245 RepID=UPI002B21C6F0|nr:glycosyltransferase [Calothrix sp. UHCC 0171]MEA5569804.1 glycosyltransferase [Calothrix sp. UHCC 0171]